MADETTPDAVEMLRSLIGTCCSLGSWMTVERLRGIRSALLAERARHAEEVAALRDQLRKVEGERDEARQLAIQWRQRAVLAEQERDCLRALLPDVRACAEYCENRSCPFEPGPVGIAARRILAALDSQGGEGE